MRDYYARHQTHRVSAAAVRCKFMDDCLQRPGFGVRIGMVPGVWLLDCRRRARIFGRHDWELHIGCGSGTQAKGDCSRRRGTGSPCVSKYESGAKVKSGPICALLAVSCLAGRVMVAEDSSTSLCPIGTPIYPFDELECGERAVSIDARS